MAEHSTMHTFTYKYENGYAYKLDCYLPDETKFGMVASIAKKIMAGKSATSTEDDHRIPVLVYWHGGGMVSGNRENNAWFPKWLLKDALNAGYAVISPDYTLLSPGSAHDSLRDAIDCFEFLSKGLNDQLSKLGSQLINPERIAVSGSSAGGYMTYLSGLHCKPKPKALLGLYPEGGDFFTFIYLDHKTEPFFTDFDPVPILGDVPYRSYYGVPADAPPRRSTPLDGPRNSYVAWLCQEPLYLDALTGIKGLTKSLQKLSTTEQKMAAIPSDSRRLFPQLTVDKSFPPMMILHGDADTIVRPYESRAFKAQLDGLGVECELKEVKGAKHGFDIPVQDSKDSKDLEGVMPWIVKHV